MKNATRRIAAGFLLTLGLAIPTMTSTGCNAKFKNPFAKKPAPPPRPDTRGRNLPDFQGYFISVKIDGEQTRKLKTVDNEQIWTVGECSSTPTVIFEVDQEKLAPVKNATITINPVIGDKAELRDIWLYTGGEEISPGRAIELKSFEHVSDGKIVSGLRALPPGRYRLSLQVNGYDAWDRQLIYFRVE